jgi:uncharacterized protein (UPF0335 family)
MVERVFCDETEEGHRCHIIKDIVTVDSLDMPEDAEMDGMMDMWDVDECETVRGLDESFLSCE